MAGAGASGLAGSAARPSSPSLPRRCLPSPRLLHVSPPGSARPPQGEGPPGGRFRRVRAAAAVGVYRRSSLYLLPAPLCSFMATPVANIWGVETRIPPSWKRTARSAPTPPQSPQPLPAVLTGAVPLQPPSPAPALRSASWLFPAAFVLFSSCERDLAFR